MKFGRIFFVCAIVGLMTAGMQCSNPSDNTTGDTNFSLWMNEPTSPMPDTLIFGEAIQYEITVGDSDGDPVTAEVSGLPQTSYTINQAADSTVVTLSLIANALHYDSVYTIRIHVTGIGAVDSMTIVYPVTIIDTTRLGGIRKLTAGLWWLEVQNDTIVQIKDSLNVHTETRDTVVHHKMNRVAVVSKVGNDYVYYVQTSDTARAASSTTAEVTNGTIYIQHSASDVVINLGRNPLGGTDSIKIKIYRLPMRVGDVWEALNYVGTIPIGSLTYIASLNDTVSTAGNINYSFGDAARRCFDFSSRTLSPVVLRTESAIMIGPIVIARAGDTLSLTTTTNNKQYYVDPDLSIPLWSYETEIKNVNSELYQVTETDTTRKGMFVMKYYDVRSGQTIQ
jgi:hypothetical protein